MSILNSVIRYFDLNSNLQPGAAVDISTPPAVEPSHTTFKPLIREIEAIPGELMEEQLLPSERGAPLKVKAKSTVRWWFPALQYLVLVLGVLIQPFFASYQVTRIWNFEGFWGWLLFSVIAGIAILPSVYRNSFDRGKPLPVQLCVLFVAGMGWESLLSTAISAIPK
jgi:hypothetical protein